MGRALERCSYQTIVIAQPHVLYNYLSCFTGKMGIKQLHKFLEGGMKKISLSADWKDKRVGVDAMCWMHRGAVACAYELICGVDTDKFVRFFVDMIYMLQFHGILPYIVFDGNDLPAKSEEAASRKESREAARLAVIQRAKFLGSEKAWRDDELRKNAVKAIRITAPMIDKIINALHYV